MLLIGERINGMFREIREAIQARDAGVVARRAKLQAGAGAHYLDINTGPAVDRAEAPDVIAWLVKTAQEETGLPCCIDSAFPEAIRAGLEVHKGKPMINSTTADDGKMGILIPLAVEFNASIIGLAMNEKGVPKDANDRLELAMQIVASADAYGLSMEDLYIDPLILPVKVAQEHASEVLETIRQAKLLASPSPRTLIGLSNVSQQAPERSLINRTYLVMAMAAGLDAAILDVEDRALMEAVATAGVLLNREVYCDAFLRLSRKGVPV